MRRIVGVTIATLFVTIATLLLVGCGRELPSGAGGDAGLIASEIATATAPAPATGPAAATMAATALGSRPATTAPAGKVDRWEATIQKFEQADRASPPPTDAVLFLGSSSIRMWKDVAEDFPQVPVINRGFGGSTIPDCTRYIDRIVVPYRPRLIVLYAGDNDIAAGRTPERVFADYRKFVEQVRRQLPKVPIAYISIKPSPARVKFLSAMARANELIRAHIAEHPDQLYIDVFTPMLGPDGQPRPELFAPDRLHLDRQGYDLWREAVLPIIEKFS